jgi:hypothetical protein
VAGQAQLDGTGPEVVFGGGALGPCGRRDAAQPAFEGLAADAEAVFDLGDRELFFDPQPASLLPHVHTEGLALVF